MKRLDPRALVVDTTELSDDRSMRTLSHGGVPRQCRHREHRRAGRFAGSTWRYAWESVMEACSSRVRPRRFAAGLCVRCTGTAFTDTGAPFQELFVHADRAAIKLRGRSDRGRNGGMRPRRRPVRSPTGPPGRRARPQRCSFPTVCRADCRAVRRMRTRPWPTIPGAPETADPGGRHWHTWRPRHRPRIPDERGPDGGRFPKRKTRDPTPVPAAPMEGGAVALTTCPA